MGGLAMATVTPLVQIIGGAFVWRSGLEVDADGAPNAYNRDEKAGLDYLDNARSKTGWCGIVTDQMGAPYVQGPDDPAPGFYVSPTSLQRRDLPVYDPRRYVNACEVPYITCTHDMRARGVMLGDVAMVGYKANTCPAIVADVGPKPGEGSVALARSLGIPSSPRNGGVDVGVYFVVFAKTAKGWPRTNEDIAAQASAAFATWGGMDKLRSVFQLVA